MKKKTILSLLVAISVFLFFCVCFKCYVWPAFQSYQGKKTLAQRLEEFAPTVEDRLVLYFNDAGISYPPKKIKLVGLKNEKKLEVWASNNVESYNLIITYQILAASGKLGPKLKEGDKQVPEGIYTIVSLNPNSKFHLSLKLNYPNEFDQKQAELDGRSNPGSDIFIHGSDVSIGCLAVGDRSVEDLFVLAAEAGLENIAVIIAPVDFRRTKLPRLDYELPLWTDSLYEMIKKELLKLAEEKS